MPDTHIITGCKVLGDRCSYRLLTPLSSYEYAAYLDKATQDYLRLIKARPLFKLQLLICFHFSNRDLDAPSNKPVLQITNQSPFRFKSRNFVCSGNSGDLSIFEIFSDGNGDQGR